MERTSATHHPWIAALVVVGTIAAIAYWPDSTPTPSTRGTTAAPQGLPAVYAEIAASTDCKSLQATFDRNMTQVEAREPGDFYRVVSFSYANAATDRMRALGCQ